MPKDYFNTPVAAATGQNHKISPQALMFERLIGELQSTLEEEVFFDDTDWPDGFDWMGEAEAVWEGLAEEANLIAKFRTRRSADRLLCRAAGVIHRAIRAGSPLELDAARERLAVFADAFAPANVRFLLEEAQACLDQMAERAAADEQNPPAADPGATFPL